MFKRWSPGLGIVQARYCKEFEEASLHERLEERFCKTLYYGALPDESDAPSLPLTSLAVDYFRSATPRGLNQVDMDVASSLAQDTWISPTSIVTSMIYAKRLRHRNPDYLLKMSSSDLFFISVMMASKYMYDEGVDEEVFNEEWAEAANLDTEEVNHLERDFLSAMDWQLFVSRSEFLKSVEAIQRQIAWSRGCSQDWLSYTDLDILCHNSMVKQIWEDVAVELIKVLSVSSTAYIAGLLTMLGSTALVLHMSTAITGLAILSQTHVQQPVVSQPPFHQPIITPDRPGADLHMPIVDDNLQALSDQRNKTRMSEARPEYRELPAAPSPLYQLLHQLWAVVAFKDRFIHLVCAFSEGLKYARPNKKIPKKCKTYQTTADTESFLINIDERLNGHLPTRTTRSRCQDVSHDHPSNQFPSTNICPMSDRLDWKRESPVSEVYWCSHGDRPPDVLTLSQYPDITRGFTTSVPITA